MRGVVLAVGVGCGLLTAGCGEPGPIPPAGKINDAGTVFTGHLEAVHLGAVSPADLGTADRSFGLRLLQDECAAAPKANAVLSPASAAQTLGMMQTGAVGATRTALSTLLHQPAYGPAVIAAEHERVSRLHKLAGLNIANRVFTQKGTTPHQTMLNDLRTAYGAQLRTLDFLRHTKASTDMINQLVSGDTHGLIPRLLDSLDSTTVAVLTNAIYLKAQWEDPFQPAVPGAFTTADGRHVTVPTLKTPIGRVMSSASADGWRSVQLPYVHGQLAAYALLPPAAAKPCAVPDTPTLTTLLRPDAPDAATVTMPKFHLAQTNELLPVLTREGFQPAGDYPGFGRGVSVSEIVQKVDISVDENGTTAAAATGGVFAASGAMGNTHVDLNRPFLFLVTDTATHTPLFLTRVADPRG
ncbi:serpin family protein [Allobranchiibius sp. CTAmp26]|uniref:serpin family protein n=1 Tax=Allobranchiibius sp. CTAmp26 TaxID=2815214 RepID=UPI001AA168F7|nr:serpin family protein [Allobranchiibius sp. CTAmp26]MBO1755834.1 hypothetical protein [Allobranchiibius sp. CTAmp26]